MLELNGGREGSIFRRGDHVIRPMNRWSPSIHLFLRHLQKSGFDAAPKFFGIEDECEVLSFVEGETYNYPLVGAIGSEQALVSAGQLLRKLHDHTEQFIQRFNSVELTWMLPIQEPIEVVCHGDFTPYNVALNEEAVVGVFDFDTAHPGPRIWDLAFSAYCWAPLKAGQDGLLSDIQVQIERAKRFCDAYGATVEQRSQLVDTVIERLRVLLQFMISEAKAGNAQFQKDIEEGHHHGYQADIDYLQANKDSVTVGLS
jgi:Ser/Thr protein kinase RdoA (MazF antagonist)